MPSILPQLLASGAIEPNHIRLVNEGSLKERAEAALDMVRTNSVSGERVVVQVKP